MKIKYQNSVAYKMEKQHTNTSRVLFMLPSDGMIGTLCMQKKEKGNRNITIVIAALLISKLQTIWDKKNLKLN